MDSMLVHMKSDKPGRAPQAADKYIVRLPDGMRDQIALSAKASGRSMNAEIVDRLLKSFEAPELKENAQRISKEEVQLIADAVCKAVAKRVTQSIPGSLDLWDTADIASYLKRSANTVRSDIVTQSSFPKPVRLPGSGQSHALYIAREVIRWAEGFQLPPTRVRKSAEK